MPKRKSRRKSAKRVARGKKLARTLPRDAKGKFLPKGSKNLFRKKRASKKRRRKSSGRKRPTPKRKKVVRRKRSNSSPARMSRGRGIKSSDNFPNFLTGKVEQSSNDEFVVTTVFTPIPRLKTIGNRATVMEVLWIDIEFDSRYDAEDFQTECQFQIGSLPSVTSRWNDPRVFAVWKILSQTITAATEGRALAVVDQIRRYDLTSKDGFGYLLASDSFNVVFKTENTARQNKLFWRMFYRFVDIPLAEFVGIVQSTQQS